jgi:tetratricopeptide (TPR) repeat protein
MKFHCSVIMRHVVILIIVGMLVSSRFSCASDESQDYALAEAFVRQGRWDEGIAVLGPSLKSDPQNLKALNLMGLALTGKGELRKANEEFQQALRISPQFLPALKNLAINEFTLKDIRASERHLLAASKLAPDDPVIQIYLGEIAYSRHDYRHAVIHLPRAGALLSKDPNVAAQLVVSYLEVEEQPKALAWLDRVAVERLTPRSQFELGLTLAQHNLFRQATSYFEAVRQSFPDSYDIGFDLGLCYVQLKEYSQAINVLHGLSSRGHKTSELDNLLAEAYEGNKQTQAAIDALRQATLLAPEDEDNYLDLAALCMNHDSFDLGMEVVNVGLHYRPQSDRLIFQRGLFHAMQNQFELAERDFQQAAELAPEKNFSYVGLGVSYMQTGNLPQAITVLRRRTRLKPDDSVLQYLLGEALVRSGANSGDPAFKEAQAALETSVKLNPNFPESRVALAKIYLKEDRIEDAVAHLEKARALDPKNQAAYSQLAIAYRRQGKPDSAKQMLSSLKELNEQERANTRGRTRIVKQSSPQDQASDAQQQRPE